METSKTPKSSFLDLFIWPLFWIVLGGILLYFYLAILSPAMWVTMVIRVAIFITVAFVGAPYLRPDKEAKKKLLYTGLLVVFVVLILVFVFRIFG